MIFTDVLMPDRAKAFFLLDEEASAAVILAELLTYLDMRDVRPETDRGCGRSGTDGEGKTAGTGYALCEDFSGRKLKPELTLKEQGIIAGMRLAIRRLTGGETGNVSAE